MTRSELIEQIFSKNSYLCVGLDTDILRLPKGLRDYADPVFEFNRQIIDATKDLCVAYKINTAFYEVNGSKGWASLEKTVNYIPSTHFKIADAKRADIGNTSTQYAKAFFETLNFDAITVAPYMGEDSIRPFLDYSDKWTIVLGLTSNLGARDFELQKVLEHTDLLQEGIHISSDHTDLLYRKVLRTVIKWGDINRLMFVIGATLPEEFLAVRKITPEHFYLVPGVGIQGGSLKEISEKGLNKDCGLLVNVSRAIIYASQKEDFAQEARAIAQQYQYEMNGYLKALQ
ncbi:MAG: orotidine-5'-phosphate decarboxylase [Flavisolibacter sp.]